MDPSEIRVRYGDELIPAVHYNSTALIVTRNVNVYSTLVGLCDYVQRFASSPVSPSQGEELRVRAPVTLPKSLFFFRFYEADGI
jgi:hypothetical protein